MNVNNLANSLQVCLDSGAKKVLIPIISEVDLGTFPPEFMRSFSILFYSSSVEAVRKELGVE